MINSNETGNIPIKSIQSASSPEGTVTSGNIAQSDYVNVATRTYTWIDNYGRSPNYVGIKNPGQPDLSPTMTLDLFSRFYQNIILLDNSHNLFQYHNKNIIWRHNK